jgi:hypothetical protein
MNLAYVYCTVSVENAYQGVGCFRMRYGKIQVCILYDARHLLREIVMAATMLGQHIINRSPALCSHTHHVRACIGLIEMRAIMNNASYNTVQQNQVRPLEQSGPEMCNNA